jgi:thiamine biosynthesis lipoprotein
MTQRNRRGAVHAITRRRALAIVAAAAGQSLLGPAAARAAPKPVRWSGTALGADAVLTIYHPDAGEARRLIALALDEVARLEAVFSLYRADSALSRLNRDGSLDAPPLDLVTLLARARRWSDWSAGAFDVTVQPLWRLYADHFAAPGADPDGPPDHAVEAARALVDYRALDIAPHRVAFARPGMAATLNGIAQGYITDRVADLLRAEGLEHVLIDLGELRVLGTRPGGNPWRVGLADPSRAGRLVDTLDVVDRAVATSAVTGTRFDAAGRHHHVFDPHRGRPGNGLLSASVVAHRATDADALSTALLADSTLFDRARRARGLPVERILAVAADGGLHRTEMVG